MSWQTKLRRLIQAYQHDPSRVGIGFRPYPPVKTQAVAILAGECGLDLPDTLRELYHLSDGMTIAMDFTLCGLRGTGFRNLCLLNERYLTSIRADCWEQALRLIFGTDEGGDFLCLTDKGRVVRVDPHHPTQAPQMADTLAEFLDSTCMGPGYAEYYGLAEDDPWMALLRELEVV